MRRVGASGPAAVMPLVPGASSGPRADGGGAPPARSALPMSPRDLLAVLFKYQRMIVALVIATLAVVITYAYATPERYEADAKLLIKFGRQNGPGAATIETPLRQQLSPGVMRREDVASEVEILTSRLLVQRAIDDVGTDRMAPPLTRGEGLWPAIKYYVRLAVRETITAVRATLVLLGLTQEVTEEQRLLLAVESQLAASPVRNTDVIEVSFRWPIKEAAADFTNRLIDRYIERRLAVHNEKGFFGFVRTEAEAARQRLEAAEQALGRFRERTGVVSLGEQRTILLKQRADVQSSLQAVREKSVELQSRLETLNGELAREKGTLDVDQGTGRNPIVDALRLRVATVELEEKDLLRRYEAGHRLVQEKRQALEELRRRLDAESETARRAATGGSTTLYTTLRQDAILATAELSGVAAREKELRETARALDARLLALDQNEAELARLSREMKVQEGQFQIYTAKQEELRLAGLMDENRLASVSIIEAAGVPIQPVRVLKLLPNRVFYILAALLASLAAGVVLSLLRDYFDRTLDTVRKVEAFTGLAVLASVPQQKRGSHLGAGALGETMDALADVDEPLVVTSATAHEGVSTTVQRLATSLAVERGRRVLIVEANYRDQATMRSPGVAPMRGLADVGPAHVEQVVQATEIPGVYVVHPGTVPASPPRFLEDPSFVEALHRLRREFDHVLVDTPPVLRYPEALVLGRLGLPVMLVVDARSTRAEVLNEAKSRIAGAHARILGVVLNFRRFHVPEAIYRRV